MKKIIALCMAGIMLASVAGCSSETSKAAAPAGPDSSAARENELYSMVVFTKGAEYFNWCYAGMKDAAKLLGSHITVELQGVGCVAGSKGSGTGDGQEASRNTGIRGR